MALLAQPAQEEFRNLVLILDQQQLRCPVPQSVVKAANRSTKPTPLPPLIGAVLL